MRSLIVLSIFFSLQSAHALPVCHFLMVARTTCKIDVRDLHPAQSGVGFRQIIDNVRKLADMSEKKLQKYLKSKPVPLILSPDKEFYMVDRHHLSRSFMELHRDDQMMFAEIKENWTALSLVDFWEAMRSDQYVWLFDENGFALSDPAQLPRRVEDLKDDPYRSLAWAVREAGGFEDTNLPFAELRWANYFRARVQVGISDKDFKKAVKLALEHAHDESASDLPGYIP